MEEKLEKIFIKILNGKISNLVENINLLIQEAQWIPNRINPKKITHYTSITKLLKPSNTEICKIIQRKKIH